MIKQLVTLASATAMAVSVGIAPAHAERLSISTWGSPQHYQVSKFIPRFEELLKEKSNGRIRTRTFAGGEMVKQEFVPTAIPQGTIDISLTTLDNWSGRVHDVSILTTPLWSKSIEWTRDNLKPGNPVFDYFDSKLQAEGAVILAMFDIGSPVLSSTFPIEAPQELSQKSIRVYSKGSAQIVQALGAVPTIMGIGDVYSGLQRGTVDAAMGGLGGAIGLKHYEVTKHLFNPNGVLGTMIHAYVMNKQKFESLAPEMQTAVMDSAQEARDSMQQFAIDEATRLLDIAKEHGNTVTSIEPDSKVWEKWQKALAPIVEKSRAAYPEELVRLIEG